MSHKILLPIRILPIVISGWFHLIGIFNQKIFNFFKEKSTPERFFFLFLFLQLVSSVAGWIEYKIVFNQIEEVARISVPWNVFFILVTMAVFFFTGFWRSSWIWILFLVFQTMLISLYAWGSLDPGLYFTRIIQSQDYYFSYFYYIFGVSSLLAWALGIAIYFQERRLRPKFHLDREEKKTS